MRSSRKFSKEKGARQPWKSLNVWLLKKEAWPSRTPHLQRAPDAGALLDTL